MGLHNMGIKTFAAIDVGSYELTMKIFEFSGKNSMRELDCISKHVDLGTDTYAVGKISNEKMDLHNYRFFRVFQTALSILTKKGG